MDGLRDQRKCLTVNKLKRFSRQVQRERDGMDGVSIQIDGITVRHSRVGPYMARSASDRTDDWPFWYVVGRDGRFNGLSSPGGGKFASRAFAERIAAALNDQRKSAERHGH